ncbi:hypothetical protein OBK04_06670 [Empedobacter falsenii]
MFRYLLIAFCSLFIISCDEDIQEEEYLVESNDNLFPKGFFSNRYFVNESLPAYNIDSIQIKYDDQKRPIEKNIKSFHYIMSSQKVKYINDSLYEISEGGVIIEKGTYQVKNYFKEKIIQKLTSTKDKINTKYVYSAIEGDSVLDSVKIEEGKILEIQKYYWNRNSNYPHLTNLDSIEIRQINKADSTDHSNARNVLSFYKYDKKQNPFIRLGIFDDINYRHLSFNNFILVNMKLYDKEDKIIYNHDFSPTKFYYKNGKVDLTK